MYRHDRTIAAPSNKCYAGKARLVTGERRQSPVGATRCLPGENYQIEGRRHHPGLGEQPVDLAAVMRLMVEKMAERQVERGHEPISPRIAVIKRLIEHRVRDAANQV